MTPPQAQSLQGILSLQAPFRQGSVQHWDDLEVLWDYIWEKEAVLSNIDNTSPADHQVGAKLLKSQNSIHPVYLQHYLLDMS